MSDGLNSILGSDDRGVGSARNVLSRLWRRILWEQGINSLLWNRMMTRYLNCPLHDIPATGNRRSSARGNLQKELSRDIMTWKVFQKAMRFLGPRRVTYIVKIWWWSGKTTHHSESVDLTMLEPDEMEALTDDWKHTVGPNDRWFYPRECVFSGENYIGEVANQFCPDANKASRTWGISEPGRILVLAQHWKTTPSVERGVGLPGQSFRQEFPTSTKREL